MGVLHGRGFTFPGLAGSAPPLLAQHDWVHVLAGYGSTLEAELEVFAFIARANDRPEGFSLLAMVVSLFETGALAHGMGMFDAAPGQLSHAGMATRVADAMRRGALSHGLDGAAPDVDLLGVDWFALADVPIDELRERFAIGPKSAAAVAAGSAEPFEPGGISEYQWTTTKAAAEALRRRLRLVRGDPAAALLSRLGPDPGCTCNQDAGPKRDALDRVGPADPHRVAVLRRRPGRTTPSSSSNSRSASSPRAATTRPSMASVADSMSSRSAQPAVREPSPSSSRGRAGARSHGVELVLGPTTRPHPRLQRLPAPRVGEHADLAGVEVRVDPRRDVAVAAVLAHEVGGPPERAHRVVREAEASSPEYRARPSPGAASPMRCSTSVAQPRPSGDIAEHAGRATATPPRSRAARTVGWSVRRPALGDGVDDHRPLEHAERRRDEVAADVRAEARAAAREVGDHVGELDAALRPGSGRRTRARGRRGGPRARSRCWRRSARRRPRCRGRRGGGGAHRATCRLADPFGAEVGRDVGAQHEADLGERQRAEGRRGGHRRTAGSRPGGPGAAR